MEPCNKEISDNGIVVFTTNSVRSVRMEEWVKAIAYESGQPVDWKQSGGYMAILALGDLHKVRKAIIRLGKIHDEFYREAIDELNEKMFDENFIQEHLEIIWNNNYRKLDLADYICSKCQGRCNPERHAGWTPS